MPSVLNQVKPSGNKPTENKSSSPNKPSENKNSVDDPTANKNTPPNAQTPQGQLPQSGERSRAAPTGRCRRCADSGWSGCTARAAAAYKRRPRGLPGTRRGHRRRSWVEPERPPHAFDSEAHARATTSGTQWSHRSAWQRNGSYWRWRHQPEPRRREQGRHHPIRHGIEHEQRHVGCSRTHGHDDGCGRRSWCRRAGHRTPEGEVKSRDPRMQGEDIASQAIGGVYRDGPADGAPTPPAVPGAPTPPTRQHPRPDRRRPMGKRLHEGGFQAPSRRSLHSSAPSMHSSPKSRSRNRLHRPTAARPTQRIPRTRLRRASSPRRSPPPSLSSSARRRCSKSGSRKRKPAMPRPPRR